MRNRLAQIFNALNRIDTKGENTLIMADCLRALADIINKYDEQKGDSDGNGNQNA